MCSGPGGTLTGAPGHPSGRRLVTFGAVPGAGDMAVNTQNPCPRGPYIFRGEGKSETRRSKTMLGVNQRYGWRADSLKTGWSESLTKEVTFQPRREDGEGKSEPTGARGGVGAAQVGQQVQRPRGGSLPGTSQGRPVQWLGERVKGKRSEWPRWGRWRRPLADPWLVLRPGRVAVRGWEQRNS